MSTSDTSMPASPPPSAHGDVPPAAATVPAASTSSYVYALGMVEPRFPTPALEKEFAQATSRSDTEGLTDREAMQAVLSDRHHRYLARQLSWVFKIEGLETYLLVPRDPAELDLLVEAIRPAPRPTDLDVVIGVQGPIAPPEMANGLMVPLVIFDQLYSFDIDSLVQAIPRPKGMSAERFEPAAQELLSRLLQLADNSGATDEHRALNYLAVRYPAIYVETARAHERNAALSAVEVRSSRLSGVRTIVDVVFSYTDRQTDVTESFFVRVDVTEEFPFLVSKLSPYYHR
jgi:hypothetical protein